MGPLIPRFANPRISNALRYARARARAFRRVFCSPRSVARKTVPCLSAPAVASRRGFTSSRGIRTGKIGSPPLSTTGSDTDGEIFLRSPPRSTHAVFIPLHVGGSFLESCWALRPPVSLTKGRRKASQQVLADTPDRSRGVCVAWLHRTDGRSFFLCFSST